MGVRRDVSEVVVFGVFEGLWWWVLDRVSWWMIVVEKKGG